MPNASRPKCPDECSVKALLHWLCRLLYRFHAYNIEALDAPGPVLLLPNHLSWWDWLFIGVCLEDDWRFVTSSTAAEISWLHRRIMINRRTFPVDMNSPYAVKRMAEYLLGGGRLVLFPEGRLSITGSLMKLFDGTGFLLWKTRPKVITAYIRGSQRLPLSPNPGWKRWFPPVSVHFSDVVSPPEVENENGREGRARLTRWLRDRMTLQRFEAEMQFGAPTLPEAILEMAAQRPALPVLQDATLQKLSYRRLRLGAQLLGVRWHELFPGESRIGVLLPNVNATPLVLLSLWLADKVPAILNFSTGGAIMTSCAQLAQLKHIITSKTFVERAHLDVACLQAAGIKIHYLEDIRAGISPAEKFGAALRDRFGLTGFTHKSRPDDTAVILFTSGSEGIPKGVELTHANLLANIRQMLSVIDLMETDRFFNALPLFHSFGLTIGLLLPLVQGVYVFLYPSPLHYRVVPSAIYNLDCTVFFGTNTFLAGYARRADPYDFRTLRYLFAGAEKVQETTAALWMNKFGVRILEGYGATECSPCLTLNVPLNPRPGSAGRFLPGIACKLEQVEGIEQRDAGGQNVAANSHPVTGRLFVRGPNIMRGYLNPEANERFKGLGGWYDTGDIVRVDSDGFVFILGRLKRFAKISGEMVSLTAVEDALGTAMSRFGPRAIVAVMAKSDATKGERLIAVTNEPRVTLDQIREAVRSRGLGNLAVPREIRVIRHLPLLGTGKIDYRTLDKLVGESRNA
jgi:acyl-[acyl-carrier-protein]-phospholipid O-acyltransferase/long-chain-fatty-acid--[acyl-carrier-protein] ligase